MSKLQTTKNLSIRLSNKKPAFHFLRAYPFFSVNKALISFWNYQLSGNLVFVNKVKYSLYLLQYLKLVLPVYAGGQTKLYILDRALLNSKLFLNFFYLFKRGVSSLLNSTYKGWLYQLNFIGLGYKVFLYKSLLYIKVGFCRVIKLEVPEGISIFSRKRNRILLLSNDFDILASFIQKLKKLRRFDFYKGKGVFEYPSFEGIKLKAGKQQQFY